MITVQKNYVQPRRVMLAVPDRKPTLSVGQHVRIGTPLDAHGEHYATVSGEILQILNHADETGRVLPHVLINNDTKNTVEPSVLDMHETTRIERYFNPVRPLEQVNYERLDTLVVDLVFFDEPFITVDKALLDTHHESIMEALRALHKHYGFSRCVLLVKDDDSSMWEATEGMPIETVRVKPTKRVDFRHTIINEVFDNALKERAPYNYLSLESMLKLREIVVHKRPSVISRVVVQGEAIKTPSVLFVRTGTLFGDILRVVGGYDTNSAITIHKNMRLQNRVLRNENFGIGHDFAGIYIQEHREREVYECIACGRCNLRCPVGILPSKIMHAVKHGIALDRMRTDLCIECGLCSFYCPSKINVMEYVKAGRALLGGKDDVT